MTLVFTDDQEQFRESIQRFLADQMPTTKVRQLMATEHGSDPAVWQQASAQLALTGIHIPEAFGGAGFGAVELGIALEEMGGSLFCGPYFSSAVLSAYALMLCGDEDQQEQWLGDIAGGERRACLAVTEYTGLWQQDDIATTAVTQSSGDVLLNGKKRFVIDGQSADLFVVVAAQSGQGIGLFVVDGRSDGMTVEALDTMDPTRKMAHIDFVDVPATALTQLPDHWLDTLLNIACITLSAEMIGGAQRLLASAVEYTQLRYQFGRSIASFQAIKHRLADLLLEVELARSAAYQAIETLAGCTDLQRLTIKQRRQLTEHASLAKAAVSETYLQAALETIQLHGGIGFTWENNTHLWFKRAKSSEVLFGTPAEHRERMLIAVEAGLHAQEEAA